MAKFFVIVEEVHTQVVEVEALDEDEARSLAAHALSTGFSQDGSALANDSGFSHMVNSDEWDVFQ